MKLRETMKKEQNTNQGITLIALAVTIVILIILATVSVSALFGENGLIKKAQEARDHQSNAIAMEEIELNKLAAEYANVMAEGPSVPADTTGPTVNIDVGTVTESSIQVQVIATDESGLAESETYKYYLNGEEKETNTTGEYTYEGLTAGTKYTIRVEVKDKVGNVGEIIQEVTTSRAVISTTTNYVGYYANLDDDPEPEGIIYEDQATGKKGSGQWGGNDGNYDISQKSGLKSYYVSQTGYSGPFGTKDVLTAVEGDETEDRFYVMALSDIDANRHYWYYSAYNYGMSDYNTATLGDFGAGKTNTATMMTKWEGSKYGSQSSNDMWGLIKSQVAQGWFVPSRAEWSAFAEELGIDNINYLSFGLSELYWSSSQGSTSSAWHVYFDDAYISSSYVWATYYVRLSATF